MQDFASIHGITAFAYKRYILRCWFIPKHLTLTTFSSLRTLFSDGLTICHHPEPPLAEAEFAADSATKNRFQNSSTMARMNIADLSLGFVRCDTHVGSFSTSKWYQDISSRLLSKISDQCLGISGYPYFVKPSNLRTLSPHLYRWNADFTRARTSPRGSRNSVLFRLLPTIHPALSNVYWFNPFKSYIKQSLRSLRSVRSQFFMVDSLLKGYVLLLDSISQAKSARQSWDSLQLKHGPGGPQGP